MQHSMNFSHYFQSRNYQTRTTRARSELQRALDIEHRAGSTTEANNYSLDVSCTFLHNTVSNLAAALTRSSPKAKLLTGVRAETLLVSLFHPDGPCQAYVNSTHHPRPTEKSSQSCFVSAFITHTDVGVSEFQQVSHYTAPTYTTQHQPCS